MTDLFAYAEEQAKAGMQRALETTEGHYPFWAEEAFAFLVRFAENRAEPFISEDVSDASREDPAFQQPISDKSWGGIYRRAIKENVIERAGAGRSRRRHNSICPRWQSLICRNREAAE